MQEIVSSSNCLKIRLETLDLHLTLSTRALLAVSPSMLEAVQTYRPEEDLIDGENKNF